MTNRAAVLKVFSTSRKATIPGIALLAHRLNGANKLTLRAEVRKMISEGALVESPCNQALYYQLP